MEKLLNFLNSADPNLLTTIPGVSRQIADDLVAARPFDSVESLLKVKGVNKKLISRIESTLEANQLEEQSSAITPVEEEGAFAPIPSQPVKEIPTADEKPSFGTRAGAALRSFVRALFRLIAILIVIGGIGAALYFGLPILRDRYIVPVEQNSVRVDQLESEVAELKNQLAEVNSRLDGIDSSIEAHTASIQKLEEMQTLLEKEMEENNEETLAKLNQEVMMTRALDTLARARLYLAQSNFGLAKEDVQSARDLLTELQSQTGDEAQAQAISRLDSALANLPAFPVVASGDLEIAWQILMTGNVAPTATPEPSPTVSATVEPTTEVTVTPTP
ncbi:MAG: helix-hairpin-helix domain-containing protein [Anaerolineae bacterium]|nr:helix-hairpin-helix domain-containing protein [Anaerolineae bacterium]MBL8106008.1 helix-hairpin-helix domain-containing protein [Anaerolineales bacterium]MCC7190198.1 helix-hairpin-helix domain-containing protein [Anaerolineales bacterium]